MTLITLCAEAPRPGVACYSQNVEISPLFAPEDAYGKLDPKHCMPDAVKVFSAQKMVFHALKVPMNLKYLMTLGMPEALCPSQHVHLANCSGKSGQDLVESVIHAFQQAQKEASAASKATRARLQEATAPQKPKLSPLLKPAANFKPVKEKEDPWKKIMAQAIAVLHAEGCEISLSDPHQVCFKFVGKVHRFAAPRLAGGATLVDYIGALRHLRGRSRVEGTLQSILAPQTNLCVRPLLADDYTRGYECGHNDLKFIVTGKYIEEHVSAVNTKAASIDVHRRPEAILVELIYGHGSLLQTVYRLNSEFEGQLRAQIGNNGRLSLTSVRSKETVSFAPQVIDESFRWEGNPCDGNPCDGRILQETDTPLGKDWFRLLALLRSERTVEFNQKVGRFAQISVHPCQSTGGYEIHGVCNGIKIDHSYSQAHLLKKSEMSRSAEHASEVCPRDEALRPRALLAMLGHDWTELFAKSPCPFCMRNSGSRQHWLIRDRIPVRFERKHEELAHKDRLHPKVTITLMNGGIHAGFILTSQTPVTRARSTTITPQQVDNDIHRRIANKMKSVRMPRGPDTFQEDVGVYEAVLEDALEMTIKRK